MACLVWSLAHKAALLWRKEDQLVACGGIWEAPGMLPLLREHLGDVEFSGTKELAGAPQQRFRDTCRRQLTSILAICCALLQNPYPCALVWLPFWDKYASVSVWQDLPWEDQLGFPHANSLNFGVLKLSQPAWDRTHVYCITRWTDGQTQTVWRQQCEGSLRYIKGDSSLFQEGFPDSRVQTPLSRTREGTSAIFSPHHSA